MNGPLRAALVIARRDYVASVFSRTFLLFLIGPLLPLLAAGLFGTMGQEEDRIEAHPTVAVIARDPDARLLSEARARLSDRLGPMAIPDLLLVRPAGDYAVQRAALLADTDRRAVAVLDGGLDAPRLSGPRDAIDRVSGRIGLLIDDARDARAQGGAPPAAVSIAELPVARAAGVDASGRRLVARLGQLVLMLLTVILSGMLLSNLIEEKSNKVIEVLAAAVPVDAIFFGKLLAMLAMSFTGIAIWGGGAAAVAVLTLPNLAAMPIPAVGWPTFIGLGAVYFAACYLLLGALFLGIGAQASTVREVQTLSMPVTMAQLGVVAFAATAIGDMDGPLGLSAAIFPWSSPFAMIARAAQSDVIWPHLLAIGWQAAWVALIIRGASLLFRRSVLKSGGGRRWFGLRRAR